MPPFVRQVPSDESSSTFLATSESKRSLDLSTKSSRQKAELNSCPQTHEAPFDCPSVRFDESCSTIHQVTAPGRKEDAWFVKEDYRRMRSRDALILDKLRKEGLFLDDQDCAHGLERKLEESTSRFIAIRAVLLEQNRQKSSGVNDPTRIAEAAQLKETDENHSLLFEHLPAVNSEENISLFAGQWPLEEEEEEEEEESFSETEACLFATSLLIGSFDDEEVVSPPEYQLWVSASATWANNKQRGEIRVSSLIRLVLVVLLAISFRYMVIRESSC